jgi:GMP synthase (glutamine-hydrolysing)
MRQALAIRHVPFEDLGSFAEVLAERGLAATYREAADGLADIDPLAADLMIILGGPIGAYQDDLYPFLGDELGLVRARLASHLPTLGLCLGAQLMARALDARVYPGPAKEIGWAPVVLTEAGRRSCLAGLDTPGLRVLHWHGDTFDLPSGATRLASTPLYENQAFSWGKAALALQFHAEVTASGMEHWFLGHACELAGCAGVSIPGLREDSRRYADTLRRQGQRSFRQWLEGVGL